MSLWPCAISGCQAAVSHNLGRCPICVRHFCKLHSGGAYHACPPDDELHHDQFMSATAMAEDERLSALLREVDYSALQDEASHFRNGCRVQIPSPSGPHLKGGLNYHVRILVDGEVDGLVARIPLPYTSCSLPALLGEKVHTSEAATIRYLHHHGLPVPRLYSHNSQNNNAVGVPYMIMDWLQGQPYDPSDIIEPHQSNFIDQLADIMIKLSTLNLTKTGALTLNKDGTIVMGPFTHPDDVDLSSGPEPCLPGPFATVKEHRLHVIGDKLWRIRRGEDFGCSALDAELFYHHLIAVVEAMYPEDHTGGGGFFIRHADDKGDHILVDREGNITGIIDWEWAFATSFNDAFCAPCALIDVAAFFDGSNSPGKHELELASAFRRKGQPALESAVLNGKKFQRLPMLLPSNDLNDPERMWPVLDGLNRAVWGEDKSHTSWYEWREWALLAYGAEIASSPAN